MGPDDRSQLPTPTLMRSARGAYAQSIRQQLHAVGINDLPRNGVFILAGVDASGGPRRDLPSELGVTQQAVSQLIDVLVNRGYLDRYPDTNDRRRIGLELTDRGREVVDAAARGVEAVDRRLEEQFSHVQIDAMRAVLLALTEIKIAGVSSGAGRRRRPRDLRRFSPIFPVRDLDAALTHYSALGFETLAYDGAAEYGFADRDGVGLHLAAAPDESATGRGSAYLYVRDADELYKEWSRPGLAGQTRPVHPTPYQLREGAHVDPDGNLIRFGSPIED
jgi:DNA-binding MarR family transcriptional regulator/catechol 2,3-dioxygenase-like lactoylglutathione lyase family enzyme